MKDKKRLENIMKKTGKIFREIALFFLVIIGIIIMGVLGFFQVLIVMLEYIRHFIVDTYCDIKYGRKEDKK